MPPGGGLSAFMRRISRRHMHDLSLLGPKEASARAPTRTPARAPPPPFAAEEQGSSSMRQQTPEREQQLPPAPPNSPRTSTAADRAQGLLALEHEMTTLQHDYDTEKDDGLSSDSPLLRLPRRLRIRIWREVLLPGRMITNNLCSMCGPISTEFLPITEVCQAIRQETLPIFYRDNRFMMPIGHNTTRSYADSLQALAPTIRQHLRHFEVPSFDVRTTAITMNHLQMVQATNIALRQSIMWHRQEVEIYWPIFRAVIPSIDRPSDVASITESVSSSLLDLYEGDTGDVTIETGRSVILRSGPPVLRLTLSSGQEIEPPELAFPQHQASSPLHGTRAAQVTQQARIEQEYTAAGMALVTERLRGLATTDRRSR